MAVAQTLSLDGVIMPAAHRITTAGAYLSDQTVMLSQLESHLWESANILCGPVDAADFRTYIYSRQFFKQICDMRS